MILYSSYFSYLCLVMRKKFGDWLLDIAKYMATAILLTSIFDEIRESWISYVSVSIAMLCFRIYCDNIEFNCGTYSHKRHGKGG